MPTLEARDEFPVYLHASMSQGLLDDLKGAVKEIVNKLSFPLKRINDPKKELIFRQKQMLQVAEEYLQEKPWITYFAAVKHLFFLRANGIGSSSFDDFKDKEYALEVESYAEKLASSSEKQIDEETQMFLQELIVLQKIQPLISQSIAALRSVSKMPLADRKEFFAPKKPKTVMGSLFSHGSSSSEMVIDVNMFFIKKIAEELKQKPETWICSPMETIEYLEKLKERRPLLEETYLQL